MKYQFIQEQSQNHSVNLLCTVMQVSRSGYYSWANRGQSNLDVRHTLLSSKIMQLFNQSRETYGYRRMKSALHARGETCGKHQVMRLMRKLGIRSVIKRKFKATTNSKHSYPMISPHNFGHHTKRPFAFQNIQGLHSQV